MQNKSVTTGLRLKSMLLDHVLICFITIPPIIFISKVYETQINSSPIWNGIQSYLMMAIFAIYFCKDSIGGRSIAKRILKLQVLDNKTGNPATPLQCLIRNSLDIIWPVEVLVTFYNPERRLGDKLAGTKVDHFNSTLKKQKKDIAQILLCLVLAYFIAFLLMAVFDYLY